MCVLLDVRHSFIHRSQRHTWVQMDCDEMKTSFVELCLHTSGKQQQGEGAILPPDDSAVGFSTDCFCFYLLSFQPGYLQDHDRYVGRILYVKMERVGARHLLLFQLFSRCSQLMRVDFEPASPAAPLSAFTP